jgi:uncharacterized membrane protein YbhN (UPF0104 family)
MPKKLKLLLGPLILLATLIAFAYYLSAHRSLLTQLRHTPPLTILWLVLLYVVWFSALIFLLSGSLRVYRKKMPAQENFLLNAYSSLINFFGPGQGGVAVRGGYLYKRHGVRLKDYMFTTLLYYAFYALTSAALLFVGSRPWWQTVLLLAVVGAGSYMVVRRYALRAGVEADRPALSPRNIAIIFGATLLQAAAQVAIYAVELHTVSPHISFAQTITYTGAANFALFVALTPGAIGIRESFLLFSERLHHIGSHVIIAANVIDRAVYLLFLGALFVLVISLHAKKKLRVKPPTAP